MQKEISPAAGEERFKKSSNEGDFQKRLKQMYAVDETDVSVCTEIKEFATFPEFPTAARISEFVVLLEELMGHVKPDLLWSY